MNDRPPLLDPWQPGVRATDVPIAENGHLPEDILFGAERDGPDNPASDIDTRKLTVTFFRNRSAQSLRAEDLTLGEIAVRIAGQSASDKASLPLLQLKTFGTQRTGKNCLRHDANVISFCGVEGDADDGRLSFAAAVERVQQAGIRALVYTSPSWVKDTKEKWRVLFPLAQDYPPEQRTEFVAWANGLLDGAFSVESFTLSQAYYFGHVGGKPYQIEMVDGDFLDQREDLKSRAIGKPGGKAKDSPASANGTDPGWQPHIQAILAGAPLHTSLRDLAAKWIASGMSGGAATNSLRALMEYSRAKTDDPGRWQARYDNIPNYVSTAEEKFGGRAARGTEAIDELFTSFGKSDSGEGEKPEHEKPEDTNGARTTGSTHDGAYDDDLGPGPSSAGASSAGASPPLIRARPFVLRDPKTLPKRQWLYCRHLIRKFASATFAPSGSGKTNTFITEGLAMATGRALLGVMPQRRLRVWMWNGEDPYDELERRVGAACLHYGISAEELDGWLFINSGRDKDSKIIIATETREGVVIAVPVVEALIQTIRDNRIDVVQIDPFISSHRVSENNNNAIDAVAKTYSAIADITNIGTDLGHHTRKTGGHEVTVEDGRGAVALLNAVRPARVINGMTEDEAARAGVTDGRRRYFRITDGKNNLSLPVDKLDWFRSATVNLGNAEDPGNLLDTGDDMGVVTKWEWPDALDGVTGADFDKAAIVIRRGKWRENPQASAWVGFAVAEALGLDASKGGADRGRVLGIVKAWLRAGSLVVVDGLDDHRETKKFVEVREDP